MVSLQGYGISTNWSDSVSDSWVFTSARDDEFNITSIIDAPASTSTPPLSTENINEHNRAACCQVDGRQESEEISRLKSMLGSLGIDLPDDLLAKMLPHSLNTTPMERILARQSIQGGQQGPRLTPEEGCSTSPRINVAMVSGIGSSTSVKGLSSSP